MIVCPWATVTKIAGTLEHRRHRALVRLEKVLALGITELWLQQAQLRRTIGTGTRRTAEVGYLGRQRVDRLALLEADRTVELIRHLRGGGRPRLLTPGLAFIADRPLRDDVLAGDFARPEVEPVWEEVLGDNKGRRQRQDQGDRGRPKVGRPAPAGADMPQPKVASEQPPAPPELFDRR